MMAWKDWPQSTRWLALLGAAGLAVCVFAMIPSPLSLLTGLSHEEAPPIKPPRIVKLPEPPALATYALISERPLFNANRQPDPLPPPPPPPAPPKPQIVLGDLAQLKLVGILVSHDATVALVRRTSGPTLTLRVGDTVDGWKVTEISARGVGLSGGDRQDLLRIVKAENRAESVHNVRAERQ